MGFYTLGCGNPAVAFGVSTNVGCFLSEASWERLPLLRRGSMRTETYPGLLAIDLGTLSTLALIVADARLA